MRHNIYAMGSPSNLCSIHNNQIPTALNLKDEVRKMYAYDISCIYFVMYTK
jgi:hypothetical protein